MPDYGREDESLFARDDNDTLVRREKETRERFGQFVTVVIDGYPVEVPRATPKTDARGNRLRDAAGELIPRTTTIHDAAAVLVERRAWTAAELAERIPVLCHMPHLHPVGVCRMCSVHISSIRRGKLTPGRKLVPACQHRVETNMVVTTRLGAGRYNPAAPLDDDQRKVVQRSAATVQKSVGLLAEMLLADHAPRRQTWEAGGQTHSEGKRYENELETVGRRLGVEAVRPRLRRPDGAFDRNRMPDTAPGETDPRRPFTKPLRRVELPTISPAIEAEHLRDPAARTAWEAWNAHVDAEFPYSSRTVVVNHDSCIVCDRCVRSCSEVKPFRVIGHTGKGYATRVSFDLDSVMGESSCVQCGECMTACPTGALSLRRRVQPRAWPDSPEQIPLNPNTPFPEGSGFLTADQMRDVKLDYTSPTRGPREVFPFATIPFAYLKWNEGAVRRWDIPAGGRRELCREGEYGNTAFLLRGTGSFEIYVRGEEAKAKPAGFFARLLGKGRGNPPHPNPPPPGGTPFLPSPLGGEGGGASPPGEGTERPPLTPGPSPSRGEGSRVPLTRASQGDACPLPQGERGENTSSPVGGRSATSGSAGVHPIYGNLVRVAGGDELIMGEMACLTNRPRTATVVAVGPATVYEVTRNLLDVMQRSASARDDLQEVYTARAIQVGLRTGRLFQQLTADERGEVERFLLESGKVQFRRVEAGETVVAEGDPAGDFYIVRMGTLRVFTTVGGREQDIRLLGAGDSFGETALLADRPMRRTATVAALDPAEVVRVPGPVFRDMCGRSSAVREAIAGVPRPVVPGTTLRPPPGVLGEYTAQGLFQAQKLLALDLTKCTRCDECTRACADSHPDGNARLLREGLRFGDFLVTASCRSCLTPYCMDGCPVDAIHRRGNHLEVVIENHCIGCGLCERNCPYGAIHMAPRPNTPGLPVLKAVNCDLCNGGEPFCVQACPHDAAVRLSGVKLLERVV